MPTNKDHATFSNYHDITTTHFDLHWTIDWEHQLVAGSVTHQMTVFHPQGVNQAVLDTRDVDVQAVEVDGLAITDFSLGDRHPVLGSALYIPLPKTYPVHSSLSLKVTYSTTKECSALGWLTAEQTTGKKHPYLYSQSQAIHARSLIPCQDSPSVKTTYSATVISTLPVLLSARRISPRPEEPIVPGKEEVTFKFEQPIKIPAYLVALASGNLAYKAFQGGREGPGGWTSGVWTEPENLEAAHWEFSEDTAKFVSAAEKLTGRPYVWGSYDVLLLPPAFPYGGMENPQITFATPTLLAGDRSLVDVIAHEISHSWFGNEIGCADWSHFWLNEGWTTYLERLIMQEAHGPPARGLSYIIGKKAMDDSLKGYEEAGLPRFQRLVVDYAEGEDPDDAFSSIPYNKGANFLLYLEQTLGGLDTFLPYIHSYVDTFAGHAITTEQWKDHLYAFWKKQGGDHAIQKLDSVDWDTWFNGEGLKLPVAIEETYDTTLADLAFELADRWVEAGSDHTKLAAFNASDIEKFEADQTVVFLEKLQLNPISKDAVRRLDEAYGLPKAGNAELSSRFFELALSAGDEYAEQAATWVSDKGRMKFCRTIYKALFKVAPKLAVHTFQEHSGFYHPIARRMIEKDLGLSV